MNRFAWCIAAAVCCGALGCAKPNGAEQSPPAAAPTSATPAETESEQAAAPHEQAPRESPEPPPEGTVATAPAEEGPSSEPAELELDGITFTVPAGWKRVAPQSRIVEAEFELPRAAGDEYDGRLTLMASGGDPQEVVANRASEFALESDDGRRTETVKIGDVEATWVDLRGKWRGPSFQPITPPRPDYRMLLLIIPFTERSAFYAKLTGPQATVAAHEDAFREFARSAKIAPRGAR